MGYVWMTAKDTKTSVDGPCAIVTGGARGIGLAIARDLASHGVHVALLDICRNLKAIPYALSSREDLETAVEELASCGVLAQGMICDVRSPREVERSVKKVHEVFGRVDILVNNAGVSSLIPITRMTVEAWAEVVDVCLKGTFLCCRTVVPHMIGQGGGRIVNIASVAGTRGLGLSTHYCAAKHGVIGLTRALAVEMADNNVLVNAVCPGTVESHILPGLASQADVSEDPYTHFSGRHLIKGHGIEPSHIAQAVRWLALENEGTITGTVLNVDAGWTAQ